jgi:hypothetical protein
VHVQVEEMLIARCHPIFNCYVRPGGQNAMRGHVLSVSQDVSELASVLPKAPADLPIVVLRKRDSDAQHYKDLKVRRDRVLRALTWLITHNKHYQDVRIDNAVVADLPLDAIPDRLRVVEDDADDPAVVQESMVNIAGGNPAGAAVDAPVPARDGREGGEMDMLESWMQRPYGAVEEHIFRDAVRHTLDAGHAHAGPGPAPAPAAPAPPPALALGSAANPIAWPRISSVPFDEFATPGILAMAFPTLFPDGRGDPSDLARLVGVPFSDGVEHLMKFRDGRFIRHRRFAFYCINRILRHQALNQSRFLIRSRPGDAHLSAEELRAKHANGELKSLFDNVYRLAGNLRGTDAYWARRQAELLSLFEYRGPPTVFVTFTCADNHWPSLHRLMPPPTPATLSQRHQAVIDNPAIVDAYFVHRLETFIEAFFYKVLGCSWHWFRIEYQHRGTAHAHGCAQLSHDPGASTSLADTALRGYLASRELTHRMLHAVAEQNEADPDPEGPAEEGEKWSSIPLPPHLNVREWNDETLHEAVVAGERAQQAIVRYFEKLTTCYTGAEPPGADGAPPLPAEHHPCGRLAPDDDPERPADAPELTNDYVELANAVERHVGCRPTYCLRKPRPHEIPKVAAVAQRRAEHADAKLDNGDIMDENEDDGRARPVHDAANQLVCRFGFPKQLSANTTLEFVHLGNGVFRINVIWRRNDSRMNTHNRFLLQFWRANVDFQPVVDRFAAARYMAKYTSKAEKCSQTSAAVRERLIASLPDDGTSATLSRRALILSIANRDWTRQEVDHYLLNLPLVFTSEVFQTVSLSGGRWVRLRQRDAVGDEDAVEAADAVGGAAADDDVGNDRRDGDGRLLTSRSFLDAYATRLSLLPAALQNDPRVVQELEECNIEQFFRLWYVPTNDGLPIRRRRPNERLPIPRFVPHFSSNPRGPHFAEYCKYSLLRYKPWTDDVSSCVGLEEEDTVEGWKAAWLEYVASDEGRRNVPLEVQRINEAMVAAQNAEEKERAAAAAAGEDEGAGGDAEADVDGDGYMRQEEWMQVARHNAQLLNVNVLVRPGIGADHPDGNMNLNIARDAGDNDDDAGLQARAYWTANSQRMPSDDLKGLPSWIRTQKSVMQAAAERAGPGAAAGQRVMLDVDPNALNHAQRLAYNIVKDFYDRPADDNGNRQRQLLMIITGTAGTGKSFLIRALDSLLGSSLLITATTGNAALDISGKTMHSALRIPLRTNSVTRDGRSDDLPLGSAQLKALQTTLTGKRFWLSDEMSMCSDVGLYFADRRLRQATGKLDEWFGGLHVILLFDFAQLPPVGGSPMYSPPGSLSVVQQQQQQQRQEGPRPGIDMRARQRLGRLAYAEFTTVVRLTRVQRQAGQTPEQRAFRRILGNIRQGVMEQADYELLKTRMMSGASLQREPFLHATRIYPTNAQVSEHNLESLKALHLPIAYIRAVNEGRDAAAKEASKVSGMENELFLCKSAQVFLTCNLWQSAGLVNGSCGVVQDIIYAPGTAPPMLPVAVMVHFPDYTGPAYENDAYEREPQYSLPVVPIVPITVTWPDQSEAAGDCSRTGVPLRLRYAITIHKSQGRTMNHAVIAIGDREISPGASFVAFSRVKSLSGLLLFPFDYQRYASIAKAIGLESRRKADLRLDQLAETTRLRFAHLLPPPDPGEDPADPAVGQ